MVSFICINSFINRKEGGALGRGGIFGGGSIGKGEHWEVGKGGSIWRGSIRKGGEYLDRGGALGRERSIVILFCFLSFLQWHFYHSFIHFVYFLTS